MQTPKAHRKPWSIGFPDVWMHADELAVKRHPHYALAKSGDTDHAALLVNELINVNIIQKMRSLQSFSPILISVHAEEEMGKNAIPEVMADVLSAALGWPTEPDVVQANVVNHTGADGFSRMARQAVFAGDIVAGCNYVIVDDFIGQGGTVANLRGYIETLGGTVLAATVLTGKPFSAKLKLSASQLAQLREKHEHIETWWIDYFGFGFDCLTESEARYLIRTPDAEHIRDRILAAA
jgi:hypoxanthine-guanine phosphoribosyltransferase